MFRQWRGLHVRPPGRWSVRTRATAIGTVLLLTLVGTVGGSAYAHSDHHPLVVVRSPGQTTQGSVVLTGRTVHLAPVTVEGGLVPVATVAGDDGAFTAEVILRPGQRNTLRVTAWFGPTRSASTTVSVRQRLVSPTGQVTGRVVDPTGTPLKHVRVSYGKRAAVTDAAGRYTLTGLPAGQVAIGGRLTGYLSGLTISTVDSAPAAAPDLILQKFAAPVRVGPAGGDFAGLGWRVQVPRGAVSRPTNLNLTPLEFTGGKESFGGAVLDLSPSGQRFAKPITVTIDPTAFGLTGSDTRIVGLNPDTLGSSVVRTRTVGGKLQFTLSTLDGFEVHIAPAPWNLWGGPSAFCTAFTGAGDADRAVTYLRKYLLPFLSWRMGAESRRLWGLYLDGGTPTTTREIVSTPTALGEFRDAAATRNGVEFVLNQVIIALGQGPPPLTAPDAVTPIRLERFPSADAPLGQNVDINFNQVFSQPGNIAGGVGSVTIAGTQFRDRRDFSGDLRITPTASERGVLTRVELEASLKLTVLDAVDLCEGDAGAGIELNATIPLSRLEATLKPGGGVYGRKLLFQAETDLNPVTRDITRLYPPNDQDSDGVPDAQPWSGAAFPLDNCPTVANASQADANGDGVGDACDDEEEPPLPPGGVPEPPPDGTPLPDNPRDPGPGGSWGDPHLITFDGASMDFQAAGDFVTVRSPSGDFEVQSRYVRRAGLSPSISINHGVAARVGDSVIAFGDDLTVGVRDPLVATLDGQPLPLNNQNLPGGAVLTVDSTRGAVVSWPDGSQLAAGRWTGDNAFVTLAPSRWNAVRGILGNADRDPTNDTVARDGTVVSDIYDLDQFYGVFGESWRVTGTDSFFRTVLPDDQVLPVRPPGLATLAGLPADVRAAAEEICRARGLTPGAGLEQCILDVALTGDPGFADNAAVVANRLRSAFGAGPLGAPVENTALIALGQRVNGALGTPFAADVLEIDLEAGTSVRISTPGACPGLGTFSITLVNPNGEPVGRTRGAGCGTMEATRLRVSGHYQLRVFDAGGFTGGYEVQVDGDQLGLTCQATEVAPNDDGSSPEIPLPFTVNFYGREFSSLWVNNNGNVTFTGPLGAFTPSPLETTDMAIIAAWWADVDTRGAGSQPVRYGLGTVDGRRSFCVDYADVGYFAAHDDKLNSFQLHVVDRGDVAEGAFDIVLRYQRLVWETGDASGGTGGIGGTSAGVGYSNGTGDSGTFHEVPGSRVPGALLDSTASGLVHTSTNSDEAGIHIFHIRD